MTFPTDHCTVLVEEVPCWLLWNEMVECEQHVAAAHLAVAFAERFFRTIIYHVFHSTDVGGRSDLGLAVLEKRQPEGTAIEQLFNHRWVPVTIFLEDGNNV